MAGFERERRGIAKIFLPNPWKIFAKGLHMRRRRKNGRTKAARRCTEEKGCLAEDERVPRRRDARQGKTSAPEKINRFRNPLAAVCSL